MTHHIFYRILDRCGGTGTLSCPPLYIPERQSTIIIH